MSGRPVPQLFTRGLSSLSQSTSVDAQSPAEQRDDAKRNMFKQMRALPTQHYWNVWFDRYVSCALSSFCRSSTTGRS